MTFLDSESILRAESELRAAFGSTRVEDAVAKLRAGNSAAPTLDILRGFLLAPQWAAALAQSSSPPEFNLMMKFWVVASVVSAGRTFPGGSAWLASLADKAFLPDTEAFYEALFEGEAAWFWVNQIGRQANSIEFGPPSGHPDLVGLMAGLRLPVECKRVRALGEKELELQRLADSLDRRLQELIAAHFPMKVIVWLHRAAQPTDYTTVDDLIASMLAQGSDEWRTAFAPDGSVQVSMAPLGVDGIFRSPPVNVTDVEASPILVPRIEIKRTADGELVRTKSILSVRSDLARDRVGNFRANLGAAMKQLLRSAHLGPGVVAIRIRPPQDHGDLFQADRVIRATLSKPGSDHVALVVLFWNDGERMEKPIELDGEAAREVTVGYSLRPYMVSNPRSPLNLEWDSFKEVFGAEKRFIVRDPIDGALKPVPPETMAVLLDGGELPPMLKDALKSVKDLREEADTATMYHAFNKSVRELTDEMLFCVLKAGARQFRVFVDFGGNLRAIEIVGARPVRVATIDLRAWRKARELCTYIDWNPSGFRFGIRTPDDTTTHWVPASPVQQFPGEYR